MGGLSKKAFQIKKQKNKYKLPSLIVDGGGMLFKKTGITATHLPPAKAAAESIAAIATTMGYSAAGIAPHDLVAGVDYLLDLQKKQSFSWLSVNLKDTKTGKRPFLPYILHKIGTTTIGIIGLTGPVKNSTLGTRQIIPWQDELPSIVSGVKDQADFIVLLSSYPPSVNTSIAEQFDVINLIIQSGSGGGNKAPQLTNNTLICQTGDQGKYLGWLEVEWNPSRKWGQSSEKLIKTRQTELDRIVWQLAKLTKTLPPEKISKNTSYTNLQEEKKNLLAEIKRLDSQSKKQPSEQPGSYTNTFLGLSTSMPDDPAAKAIVLNARRTVNKLNQEMLKQQGEVLKVTGGIADLIGWKKCKECHPLQTAFWQQTQHMNAYQTLVDAQAHYKPDCLWCHITLPSYESDSFSDNTLRIIRVKPQLQNIGCETCHGPGKKHSNAPEKVHLHSPKSQLCLTCHTEEHDDNFQFNEALDKIRCPKQKTTQK